MRRAALIAVVVVSVAAEARADDILGAPLTVKLEIPTPDGPEAYGTPDPNTYEAERRFNWARCVCGEAQDGEDGTELDDEIVFAPELDITGEPVAADSTQIEVWLGTACGDPETRDRICGDDPVATPTVGQVKEITNIRLNVYDLMEPVPNEDATKRCDPDTQAFDSYVWVGTDIPPDMDLDDEVQSAPIRIDLDNPPALTSFTRALGSEEAIQVAWNAPADPDLIFKWQILCATADGQRMEDPPNLTPAWETPRDVCGSSVGVELHHIPVMAGDDDEVDAGAAAFGPPIDAGDAGDPDDAGDPGDAGDPVDAAANVDAAESEFPLPAALENLDETYLCGEAANTATSITVNGLINGEGYVFVLLAVDQAGNATAHTYDAVLTPMPVTDFWEDLNERDSRVEGGFCLFAETYGDGGGPGGALTESLRDFRDETLASSAFGRWLIDVYYDDLAWLGQPAREHVVLRVGFAIALLPVVAFALAWHAIGLPALLALFVAFRLRRRMRRALIAAIAVLVPATASAQSFAPYWADDTEVEDQLPEDIEWHVGVRFGPYVPEIDEQFDGDPYHDYFGGYKVLPVLDVDRILLHAAGGQIAVGGSIGYLGKKGNAIGLDGMEVEGVETKFRLLPLTLQAAYRLTWFSDEHGVPVIPYVRGGLAYYVWQITKPNGDTSDVGGDKGRGATPGVVASAGLAVRAEQIDEDSAVSMRESGLQHAGFYAEYQVGWVDGFGSDTKLRLGDKTWFVGFDFEF